MKQPRFKYTIPGFSLLELLIVASIVIILAAFTIPGYMRYVTQSRVNALWHEAEAAKLAVISKYVRDGTAVDTVTVNSGDAEYTTSNSDLVKCVTIQDGIVSVVGNPDMFNDELIWIAWQPTDTGTGIDWSCIYPTTVAPYVSGVNDTCAAFACEEFSSWGEASTISSETFWYFGTLSQSQVSSAFANNCNTSASMAGCADCYNYVNTDTTQRYMTFDLSNTTYNYQGALAGGTTWNSFSSWSYQYTYTIVTQSCMQQTRTSNPCEVGVPFASDAACT